MSIYFPGCNVANAGFLPLADATEQLRHVVVVVCTDSAEAEVIQIGTPAVKVKDGHMDCFVYGTSCRTHWRWKIFAGNSARTVKFHASATMHGMMKFQ